MKKTLLSKFLLSIAGIVLLTAVLLLSGCNQTIAGFFGKSKTTASNKLTSSESITVSGTVSGSTQTRTSSSLTSSAAQINSSLAKAAPTYNLKDKETSKYIVTIYYSDDDGYIIPVSRALARQEAIARATVTEMIDSIVTHNLLALYGLEPVLDSSTTIRGINIKESVAIIDFGGTPFLADNEEEEAGKVAALVYTLTGFSTINKVKIQIDGYEITELKHGTQINEYLDRSNIMINSRKANLSAGLAKSDIYFYKVFSNENEENSDEGIYYLVPVSIEHTKVSGNELPEKLLELYDMNYGDSKLISHLPKQLSASDIEVSAGVAAIDVDEDEPMAMDQLLYAFKQIQGLVGLKTNSTTSGYIDFPTYINAYIND